MELTEIITELETYTGKFPRLALERAIEEREAITPILLATLEKWKDNLEELSELPNYFLHTYAFYLLAQFKEPRAYPLIIEFFSAPGKIALDVTGDLVTEDLGRILASVYDGNLEPIQQLIENQQANEYVRSAALGSLRILVARGTISRELVIEYFGELFSTRLEKEYSYIWTNLVSSSAQLCALELKNQINEAFDSDLIDPFFVNQKDVDYYFKLGQEEALNQLRKHRYYSLIEDTIAEMENWACFRVEEVKKAVQKPPSLEGFYLSPQKRAAQGKNKAQRKVQKQSRRKNRPKK